MTRRRAARTSPGDEARRDATVTAEAGGCDREKWFCPRPNGDRHRLARPEARGRAAGARPLLVPPTPPTEGSRRVTCTGLKAKLGTRACPPPRSAC